MIGVRWDWVGRWESGRLVTGPLNIRLEASLADARQAETFPCLAREGLGVCADPDIHGPLDKHI
jgi:hypothetical protein